MKLYIKQKVFSWGAKFTVKDEIGNDKYYVEGEVFSCGRKLHIIDLCGNEVAFIKQKPFSFFPKYFVYVNGNEIAEIVKRFSFLGSKHKIEGHGWDIDGDLLLHNYAITQNGNTIVSIQKKWITWGDSYELDISDSADEITAIAVALTIDCMLASRASNSSS